MAKEKLKDRARDELFSHINRCGVLKAEDEDQRTWMDETIEYIGERYPDLTDSDLQELHAVGMRFCKPAIPHGAKKGEDEGETEVEAEAEATPEDANAA